MLKLTASLLLTLAFTVGACAQDTPIQLDGVTIEKQYLDASGGQKEAAMSDLNDDGRADLVIAARDSISVWTGRQTGSLAFSGQVPAGPNPVGPAVANLDGDGHLDVAVANHDTQLLTLLRGNGSGHLQPFPKSPLTIDVAPHPHAVRAADLDGDGSTDLIIDHRGGEGLLILRGMGAGDFATPGTLIDAGGDPYRGMAVGDLNKDGPLDLVTPNPDDIGILLSTDPNDLAFSRDSIATEAGPFAVDLGDLNGDGRLDVIAALDEGSPLVQVFLGDGTGSFREADDSPFRLAPGGKMVTNGDFNGDGVGDAAVTCWNASEVLVLLGGAESIRTARLSIRGTAWGPAAGDLNGDGIDDLVIPDASSERAVTFLSRVE